MFTCYVLSDYRIVSEIFNPTPGQVLAKFESGEPSIPFDPMNNLGEYVDEVAKLREETMAKAIAWVEANRNV